MTKAEELIENTKEVVKFLKAKGFSKKQNETEEDGKTFQIATKEYLELIRKKYELIQVVITSIFKKGVLVEGELSNRNGGLYRGREHREMTMKDAKKKILANIHEVAQLCENVELLELCLDKVKESEFPRDWWKNCLTNEDINDTCLKIKAFEVLCGDDTQFELKKVDEINITPNGEILFKRNGYEEELGYSHNAFVEHFEPQILEKIAEINLRWKQKIETLKEEIETISDKGSKYVVLNSLRKQNG